MTFFMFHDLPFLSLFQTSLLFSLPLIFFYLSDGKKARKNDKEVCGRNETRIKVIGQLIVED